MPDAGAAAAVEKAVANTGRRERTVGIAVLVAIGLMLLYKCLRGRADAKPSGTRGGITVAPDTNEASLRENDAAAVRAAAARYGKDYQDRMNQMVAPKAEEGARPFIGFSLADNIRGTALVVDGVFMDGPAYEVGVDIDHELLAIAGETVKDIETVRKLVSKHCKPGHVTRFTFFDADKTKKYETEVWVMTADEKFRGKPYFFAPHEHEVRQSDRLKQTWRPGQTPEKSARK